MTDSMQEPGPDPDGGEGPDLVARVLAGAGNCPADVVALAQVLAVATETPVIGDLATGAGVAVITRLCPAQRLAPEEVMTRLLFCITMTVIEEEPPAKQLDSRTSTRA